MNDEHWPTWRETKAKRPVSPQRAAAASHANQQEDLAFRLAELRADMRVTQAELGRTMGVSQRRVSAIEHGEVPRTEVSTIMSYVAALGGTVRIVADFGDRTYTLVSA